MDPLRLHQDMMSSHETVESMLVGTKAGESKVDYNKANIRPADEALRCPRCDSSNTKFCYYNNYSLTQPRYFCKSCRRYWTKGGTLRNVPVGGGCRKNKRSSSSKIRTIHQDHPQPPLEITPNPLLLSYDTTDLSLAFATLQNGQLGFDHDHIPMLGNYPNKPYGSCGFVEIPPVNSSLQNVYYGGESFENVGQMMSKQEMGNLPYEALITGGVCTSSDETTAALTVASVKQEGCNVDSDGGDRVFCGYPWQIGGGEDVEGSSNNDFMGDVGRQSSWINGLHWHGLLNSTPLM